MKNMECRYYLTNNGTNAIEVASNGYEFIIRRIMNRRTLRDDLQVIHNKERNL